MINNLKWRNGMLYYRRVTFWHTSPNNPFDFFLVPQPARPDFRWQQARNPACASAARPQGNHAEFNVAADDIASGLN
jgi:hypothetical protein